MILKGDLGGAGLLVDVLLLVLVGVQAGVQHALGDGSVGLFRTGALMSRHTSFCCKCFLAPLAFVFLLLDKRFPRFLYIYFIPSASFILQKVINKPFYCLID